MQIFLIQSISRCTYRALDKDEYNHITATYFLLAERRLKVSRQEQAPLQRSLSPLSKQNAAIKITTDTVDGPNEIRNNNNLLAPPSAGFYNNSRLAPVDTNTTTVSSIGLTSKKRIRATISYSNHTLLTNFNIFSICAVHRLVERVNVALSRRRT